MDLKAVREAAIEATTRAFWDKNGFVPDQDSDEWEEEYRRQFEQVKRRHATGRPPEAKPAPVTAAPAEEPGWAELTGAPTQIRWAAALRSDRLKEIRDPGIRHWLATTTSGHDRGTDHSCRAHHSCRHPDHGQPADGDRHRYYRNRQAGVEAVSSFRFRGSKSGAESSPFRRERQSRRNRSA